MKNARVLVKSGYLPAMLGVIAVSSIYLWHLGKPYVASVSFEYSLSTNTVAVFFYKYLSSYAVILLIVPILIVGEDLENRNFEIMKTYDFNVLGYFFGNFLSLLFVILIPLMEIAYISELMVFGEGYKISSGFLIDPIIISLAFLVIFLVPLSLVMLVSPLVSNRVMSIILIIFINFQSVEISNAIAPKLGYLHLSWLNQFIVQISGSQSFYVSMHLLSQTQLIPSYHDPISSQISMILQGSLILLVASYLILIGRKNGASLTEGTLRFIGFFKRRLGGVT